MSRPTQTDVAKHAGVSRATVSYVLNDKTDKLSSIPAETQQRVLDAIEELGYEPDAQAQALRSGSTKTIALLIPDLQNPHFCEFATGVEKAARAAGYQMLLSSTTLSNEHALEAFKDLARRRVDGLIVASAFLLDDKEAQDTLDRILKRNLPIVDMGDFYEIDSASSNYSRATEEVISYLLSLGHQRIGLVYGVAAREHGLDRLEAYWDSLAAAEIAPDPNLVAECGPTIKDGYQGTKQLLELPNRPTAIIVINDLLAIGALRAAADLGIRVPDELSIVGYDDISMANYLVPRLTTVTKNAFGGGQKAFELLITRIQNPKLPRRVIEDSPKLIVRESTGPAPF